MFSRATDASKIALVWLVARLRAGSYQLLDTQFTTEHLESLGAVEIPRRDYKAQLAHAISVSGRFHDLPEDAPADVVLDYAAGEPMFVM